MESRLDGTAVSRYDYENDAAARRTDVVMTGTAFNQNTFNAYAYNDRSEVVGGQKYAGTDPNDKSNPIPSYDHDYNYDPIGNRQTFTESGTQTSYTANSLNQYSAISTLTDPVQGHRGQALEFVI